MNSETVIGLVMVGMFVVLGISAYRVTEPNQANASDFGGSGPFEQINQEARERKMIKMITQGRYVFEPNGNKCYFAYSNQYNGYGLAGPVDCNAIRDHLITPEEKKQGALLKDKSTHATNSSPRGKKCCADGLSMVRIRVKADRRGRVSWHENVCLEDLKPATRKFYKDDVRPLTDGELKQCDRINPPPQKKTGSLLRQGDDGQQFFDQSGRICVPSRGAC